jgi:hypothetical protein
MESVYSMMRYILASVLLLAAAGKISAPSAVYRFLLDNLRITESSAQWLIGVLIASELGSGLALLFRKTKAAGIVSSIALTAVFLLFEILRPRSSCPCFGELSSALPFLAQGGLPLRVFLFVAAMTLGFRHLSSATSVSRPQ